MSSSESSSRRLRLHCGDVDPNAAFSVVHYDDHKCAPQKKTAACMENFRKNMKTGKVDVPKREYNTLYETEPCPRGEKSRIPNEMVVFKPKPTEEYENAVEYDCDEEDGHFLRIVNDVRKSNKQKPYTVDNFSAIIDCCEKRCQFDVNGPSSSCFMPSIDSDDVCSICLDGDVNNANAIIYCDFCNIPVHQDCYGVPYVPEGQWLCRRCRLSPSKPVDCCLCPNKGGAFKQTLDGRWAHVTCAVWLNEVHFGNVVFCEPIEGVDQCLKNRSKLKCLLCSKKVGACVQCSNRNCARAFHVTCAQQSGMHMRQEVKEDPKAPDGLTVKRIVLCFLHDDSDDLDAESRKKRMGEAARAARKSITDHTRAIPEPPMPTLSPRVAVELGERFDMDVGDCISYWYQKRKSRCGVPMIRRLQLQQRVRAAATSQRTVSEEDQKLVTRYQVIRYGLETARLLLEQVKKRELHKRNHLQISQDIFEKILMPESEMMRQVMDKLDRRDKQQVFAKPVEIEGYGNFVKKPIDLALMRKKLESGKYDSLSHMRTDVLLMMENCEKFNTSNEWYLNYGRKFKRAALSYLSNAEKMLEAANDILEQNDAEQLANVVLYEDRLADVKEETPPPVEKNLKRRRDSIRSTGKRPYQRKKVDAEQANNKDEAEEKPTTSTRSRRSPSPPAESTPIIAVRKKSDRNGVASGSEAAATRSQSRRTNGTLPFAAFAQSPASGNLFTTLRSPPTAASNGKEKKDKRKKVDKEADTPTTTAATPTGKRKRKDEGTPSGNGLLSWLTGGGTPSSRVPMSNVQDKPSSTAVPVAPVTPNTRRSTLRHAAPLMLFRDNNVTSPLPADVASSESSAEEDETRSSRRRARMGIVDHAKVEHPDSDSAEFQHNDLVVVNGVAGRVIEAMKACIEDDLPRTLQNDCRTNSKRHSHLCVFLFGNENKWGWYQSDELRALGSDKTGVNSASFRQAMQWRKRLLDAYQ